MKNLLGALARFDCMSVLLTISALGAALSFASVRAETTEVSTGSPRAIAASSHKLVWSHDLRGGMEAARRDNKLVLVDLYTDWCGWCKKLDKDTYTNPEVTELLNSRFVCVKLDAEDGAEGESFAKQHKVRGYPCIIVLDSAGKLKNTNYGYRNAQDFLELLKGIPN
jgi:thiol:disulfide interchange protein